ncbi:uncharacterized protein LOC100577017 [Apis mellifera]|uniref:Uncharacterized protein LOC100577017 n=1 Tax=Apis mellifera TaxID=7460 RepID=A0A7M7SQE7_APIME|nr:uncharacterized protein LOC100577017 [Apis mellifera]|eukprot:XP_026298943.1 uncharacterized protein LOC100577017 [Apis mellifera]
MPTTREEMRNALAIGWREQRIIGWWPETKIRRERRCCCQPRMLPGREEKEDERGSLREQTGIRTGKKEEIAFPNDARYTIVSYWQNLFRDRFDGRRETMRKLGIRWQSGQRTIVDHLVVHSGIRRASDV